MRGSLPSTSGTAWMNLWTRPWQSQSQAISIRPGHKCATHVRRQCGAVVAWFSRPWSSAMAIELARSSGWWKRWMMTRYKKGRSVVENQ